MSMRLQTWFNSIQRVRCQYREKLGHSPSLFRPTLFSEKLQWRKLFDDNPLFTPLLDKHASRAYITARGLGHLQIPILWVGDDPAEIPFDDIEPPFVIKSTHASAHVIFINQRPYDVPAILQTTRRWLNQCYGSDHLEPGYIRIPKQVIIERRIGGDLPPYEYKLFVFHGIVRLINVIVTMPDRSQRSSFHLPNWERLDWVGLRPPLEETPPPPENLAELVTIGETLGADLDHVRVDLYDTGSQIYVGELTLYSQSGFHIMKPETSDAFLGDFWQIEKPMSRALRRIFTTDWGAMRAG